MPEAEKLKRPAAHRWAIGLLCFMTVTSVIFLTDSSTARGGANSTRYWIGLACLCGSLFTLFCLVVGGRHRWAYYVTSGVLGIWALRGICNLFLFAWLFAFGKRPAFTIYSHPERVNPSLVRVATLSSYVIIPLMIALTVWLFVRFTFSRESRSYFQLKKKTGNDGPVALPVEKVH